MRYLIFPELKIMLADLVRILGIIISDVGYAAKSGEDTA